MFRRALISVSNKDRLKELAQFLAQQGTEIVSTGGSAQALREAGIAVIDVSEMTGFPEVMDGRVKTLHPNVHMALLARKDNVSDQEVLKKFNVQLFDLVVVNLYPFEKALLQNANDQDQIEKIDVGGPTMLRAAAKSFDRITVLSDPKQYDLILSGQEISLEVRRRLAAEVFAHVSSYDSMVSQFLDPNVKDSFSLGGSLFSKLRYGENPHQQGWWYQQTGAKSGWHKSEILQGKELSYNNLLDLDAAQNCLKDLKGRPSCVVVKHNNPCGAAQAENIFCAVDEALKADPISCFGGIVAVNGEVDERVAERLGEQFLECIVAPAYTSGALNLLKKKKNQRVLRLSFESQPGLKISSIEGGFLVQPKDQVQSWNKDWKVLGAPLTEAQRADLSLAWQVCAHLKSNAITLVAGGKTVGLGMGQVSRVDSVEQSIGRWKKYHPTVTGVVAASDAFFPFPDSIELLAAQGVKAIIQPGGSIKDEDIFRRAQELGVTLVITGQRHFRH